MIPLIDSLTDSQVQLTELFGDSSLKVEDYQ